jgi:hypothetical protein
MSATRMISVLVLCALSASLGAQNSIVNNVPAVIGFVDLSTNGGTQLTGVGPDSEHNIVTTIGNPLCPAGNVRISNNGVVIPGITAGEIGGGNVAFPTSFPFFLPLSIPALPAILVYWDDLHTPTGITFIPFAQIWWKEDAVVLYIMWKGEYHFGGLANGQTITFELQVFGSPGFEKPWIQMLYPDTTFGGTMAANNHGLSATVGYLGGGGFQNVAGWSFNTASVPDGTVLSIRPHMSLTQSSPSGPGSIRLNVNLGPPNSPYFLALTGFAGAFPNGWLYGLDIPFVELMGQLEAGFPFNGTLDTFGNLVVGPFVGLPSGLTLYSIAFAGLPGTIGPVMRSQAVAHTIP